MATRRSLMIVLSTLWTITACTFAGAVSSTVEPASTDTPALVPVELDLCTLLTTAEVSETLGDEVVVQPDLQTGACTFSTTASPQPKSVSVSAAQGGQARELILMSASLGMLFGGDPALQQVADDLRDNAAAMDLDEVVARANSLLVPLGYLHTPAGTPERPTIWGWNAFGAGSLQLVQDDTYLAVSVIGLDETAALAASEALIDVALERLPAAFTIELAESLRVEFTIAPPTAEAEASPTTVPPAEAGASPTMVPTSGAVPSPTLVAQAY